MESKLNKRALNLSYFTIIYNGVKYYCGRCTYEWYYGVDACLDTL